MTRATDLSDAIEQSLEQITPANGFATDIKAVYGFGKAKPDNAPLPCLVVSIGEDTIDGNVGKVCKRQVEYKIDGVFNRAASLQELQRCHHDILRSLGYGDLLPSRVLNPGEVIEESAEFDPDTDGSNLRRVSSSITIKYVEKY